MAHSEGILTAYIRWHYGEAAKTLLEILLTFIAWGLYLFSVGELMRTIFSPWKQVLMTAEGPWWGSERLEALSSNLISRVLGAIVRLITIALGLTFSFLTALIAGFVFIFWLLAPFLAVALPVIGFGLLAA